MLLWIESLPFSQTLWLQGVLIVAGIVLVLWGADRLTEGAVVLAERLGMSQIVIGLTVVAFGTSAPEFCVSLVSALNGTPDLAIGNVVGSNIFNAMLIAGIAAMVAPIDILPVTVGRDLPVALVASVALSALVVHDSMLSRLDAACLLLAFVVFMWFTLAKSQEAKPSPAPSEGVEKRDERTKGHGIVVSLGLMVVGLTCLIVGSNIFVEGASAVAAGLGVSEAVIGLTIVAGGTSLPELATSVVAARKGKSGLAIGNVLGSNVMNILLILGGAGVICPMAVGGITPIDFAMLVGSSLLLWMLCFTKYQISRREGCLLTVLFMFYMVWLVATA